MAGLSSPKSIHHAVEVLPSKADAGEWLVEVPLSAPPSSSVACDRARTVPSASCGDRRPFHGCRPPGRPADTGPAATVLVPAAVSCQPPSVSRSRPPVVLCFFLSGLRWSAAVLFWEQPLSWLRRSRRHGLVERQWSSRIVLWRPRRMCDPASSPTPAPTEAAKSWTPPRAPPPSTLDSTARPRRSRLTPPVLKAASTTTRTQQTPSSMPRVSLPPQWGRRSVLELRETPKAPRRFRRLLGHVVKGANAVRPAAALRFPHVPSWPIGVVDVVRGPQPPAGSGAGAPHKINRPGWRPTQCSRWAAQIFL